MIHKSFLLFFPFCGLIFISSISAQKTLHFKWSVVAELPPVTGTAKNPGVAGAFAGIHQDVLLIAGGANFPDGMPWEGGKKIYWENIYVLKLNDNADFKWISQGNLKLKHSIAYGASISTVNGLICIGGENENGISKSVFLLQWNKLERNVIITSLPDLPLPLTNLSAAISGKCIYVAGGETLNGVSDEFYFLDLEDSSSGWKQLPSLPKPLSHAVLIAQRDGENRMIYLMGGRRKKADGISELSDSVFGFDIQKNRWTEKKSLPFALSAGTGIAFGENQILMFGGDRGETFQKTEVLLAAITAEKNKIKKQKLIQQKNKLQQSHPGFSKEVLCYRTEKNEWELLGEMHATASVTTTAVKWKNCVIIPGGEIRAGVRTPEVLTGKFKPESK